jgi:hypothetical protein
MVEVSKELIYDMLKKVHIQTASLHRELDEMKTTVQALRAHTIAVLQDIQNIYGILSRHDAPLARIERRLEIAKVG